MFAYISNETVKVFGIGLSRTGTSSLNRALSILGYRAFHWRFHPENRLLRLEDAYFCDAITDINAAFTFETLYHVFPRSKFIYTVRSHDAWAKSVSEHYNAATPAALKRRLNNMPVSASPVFEQNSVLYRAIHDALYTAHASWTNAYKAHDVRVRRFFDDRRERLLEFDLFERNDGWPELCAFLERPAPAEPFPMISWKFGEQRDVGPTGARSS